MDALERLTSGRAAQSDLLALTHVHRYRLAAELCEGMRVLDLCCGSGYGSRLLAERARSVHGVDLHGPSIERAQEDAAGQQRLSFECADAHEVLGRPLGDDFDAIVLFEGLEHLPELERAVQSLRSHVDAGLALIVSLPNSRAFEEDNPHHVTDFDYETAVGTFERIGASSILFQFHAEGSLIRSGEDGPLDGFSALGGRAEPEHCNHLIALANMGSGTTPEVVSARMQLAAAPTFNSYMIDLERINERLWRTNLKLSRQRLGVADSAAAAAIERLRQADEEAEIRAREQPPPSGPLGRAALALKRVVTLILPHGLVVAWMQGRTDDDDVDR